MKMAIESLNMLVHNYCIAAHLTNTDKIMNDSLWVGVYPGMKQMSLVFMMEAIHAHFLNRK